MPTNIAEGSRRRSRADYARFLNIAEGSLAETEYLTLLSGELGYLPSATSTRLAAEFNELGKMLYALRSKVEALARSERAPTRNSQLKPHNS